MNLPKEIKIMGSPFRVEVVADTLHAEHAGSFDVESQVISIADEAGPGFRIWLLLTQAISILDWLLEIGLEQPTIAGLTTGLKSLLSDNPEVLDFIADGRTAPSPEAVYFLGLRFDLEAVAINLESDNLGTCTVMGQRLRMAKGLEPEMAGVVSLHEALHAISYLQGLDLEEGTVQRLASGVRSLLVENPQFVKLLKGG